MFGCIAADNLKVKSEDPLSNSFRSLQNDVAEAVRAVKMLCFKTFKFVHNDFGHFNEVH